MYDSITSFSTMPSLPEKLRTRFAWADWPRKLVIVSLMLAWLPASLVIVAASMTAVPCWLLACSWVWSAYIVGLEAGVATQVKEAVLPKTPLLRPALSVTLKVHRGIVVMGVWMMTVGAVASPPVSGMSVNAPESRVW